MKVNEIFKSCQGEGMNVGLPAVFIRLAGCNLKKNCVWCDTKYAQTNIGETLTVDEVKSRIVSIDKFSCGYFCISGGEPLLQEKELYQLICEKLLFYGNVEIFTNGTILPPKWSKDVQWCVDFKCPSARIIDASLFEQWNNVLSKNDVIKFVVADELDLAYVLNVMKTLEHGVNANILISPAICSDVIPSDARLVASSLTQREWMKRVWQFCVDNNFRFSLQVHKVLFDNKRGV